MSIEEHLLLPWDGSYLGSFSWMDLILDWIPAEMTTRCNKPATIYAVIRWNGSEMPVVLKPNIGKKVDQCVIDELKTLFGGVRKMGTHLITLDARLERTLYPVEDGIELGSNDGRWFDSDGRRTSIPCKNQCLYFMFKARVRDMTIVREKDIRGEDMSSSEDIDRLQRIFVFSNVIGPSDKCASNIIRLSDGDLMPVDEMSFKMIDQSLRHQRDLLYKNVMNDFDQEELFNKMTGGKIIFLKRAAEIIERLQRGYKSMSKVLKDADDLSWMNTIIECRVTAILSE